MKTAFEYTTHRNSFMCEYENTVRSWLRKQGGDSMMIADDVPFFMDGIVNPDVWFGSNFRPLFIMKEPYIGLKSKAIDDIAAELKDYGRLWGGKTFEFVEDQFSDIQIGIFPTWMRIAKLTNALYDEVIGGYSGCSKYDFTFKYGGERNPEISSVNANTKYAYQTNNQEYITMINKIAVINIKKIGSGVSVDSDLSKAGQHFLKHLFDPMKSLLYQQICEMEPTIIVCCGSCGKSLKYYFDDSFRDDRWIEAYHPSYIRSDDKHCRKVVEQYRRCSCI